MSLDQIELSRRVFLKQAATVTGGFAVAFFLRRAPTPRRRRPPQNSNPMRGCVSCPTAP